MSHERVMEEFWCRKVEWLHTPLGSYDSIRRIMFEWFRIESNGQCSWGIEALTLWDSIWGVYGSFFDLFILPMRPQTLPEKVSWISSRL